MTEFEEQVELMHIENVEQLIPLLRAATKGFNRIQFLVAAAHIVGCDTEPELNDRIVYLFRGFVEAAQVQDEEEVDD